MKTEIILTEDGSHTLFIPRMNERYHSVHGAIRESQHVFISAGLAAIQKSSIRVCEVGLGTGLNLLLTWRYAIQSKKEVLYHGIEKYPLPDSVISRLNYGDLLGNEAKHAFAEIHRAPWDQDTELEHGFVFRKIYGDMHTYQMELTPDVVYFDAFGPDKQPDIWNIELFEKIYRAIHPGGLLVTYSSKGSVKRMLKETGFTVETLKGPPGKREMLRAIKTI
ncbi:MAG: tRNA (5-methylaminomethyl-2-thiouridine)(34)-methyltransferase MnmD [Bacteroidales bacterium]